MIDGILLINKEEGITSYDVIRRLKKTLPKKQKIGHAGTLDPFATGLLIILLGRYTKKMVEILEMEKEYIVTAEFGYATDTQDIKGEKIMECDIKTPIQQADIENVLQKEYHGNISQIPPQYSAKKIKGKKAYEYARKGEKFEIPAKDIYIEEFKIVEYSWPKVQFKVVCSSGTYVRTLIDDLAKSLDSCATAVALERTRIGGFNVEEALPSSDITKDMDLSLKKEVNA